MEQLDPVGHLFPEAWRGDPGSEHEREVRPEQTESTYRGILPHQGLQLHPSVMQSPTAGVQSGPQEAWGGCPGLQSGRPGGHPKPPSLSLLWFVCGSLRIENTFPEVTTR